MLWNWFGPRHTLADALVILEEGLRNGSIVLDEEGGTSAKGKQGKARRAWIEIRGFSARASLVPPGRRIRARQGDRVVVMSPRRKAPASDARVP